MLKLAVVASLLAASSAAFADTETTSADTLVVVTPNAPIVVTQGQAAQPVAVAQPVMAPGAAEMPPPPPVMPAATMNGAPQNEHWSNVSHINGVPVKVGERQDYLFKPKKFNLSTNPFGFFFGYYDVAASMALGSNLGATVAITGWAMDDPGYQLSATLPLYFRKTFSGPFLEGGLLIRSSEEENYDYYAAGDCIDYCYSTENDSWVGPQLLFGWHWTFDSGLNTSFAFGVARRMGGDENDTEANGYWRVGYAF